MRLVTFAAIAVLAGCGQPEPPIAEKSASRPEPETAQQVAVERASRAADALAADLMSVLAQEMASGGPASAIRVCAEVAQQRSAEHSRDGLVVRRVSRKARNPQDRPDDYERAALERLQTLHDQGQMPPEVFEVVEQDGERALRYLRPIQTAELCLACHGDPDDIAPEVKQLIEERYPEDAATGYEAGQLRGAVSVTVALDR